MGRTRRHGISTPPAARTHRDGSSIRFDSIRFDSIRFDAMRFDSVGSRPCRHLRRCRRGGRLSVWQQTPCPGDQGERNGEGEDNVRNATLSERSVRCGFAAVPDDPMGETSDRAFPMRRTANASTSDAADRAFLRTDPGGGKCCANEMPKRANASK